MAARYPRCPVLMWLHGVVRRRYVAAMVRREEESGRVCMLMCAQGVLKRKRRRRKKKKECSECNVRNAGIAQMSCMWQCRVVVTTQIYKRDPRLIPPHVVALWAKLLKLGVFRFLPTTHMETHPNKIRPQFLCMPCSISCMFIFTLRPQCIPRTWWIRVIMIVGKAWRPPIWAPCQD